MIKRRELRLKEIEKKLSDVTDSVELVAENLPEDFDSFILLGLSKDGIYKKIEFAIESLLDICNVINSDLRLGSPETEESILEHMEQNRIFSKTVVVLIREMKRFRNILIHRYGDIDDKKAFESIGSGLKDFDLIVRGIEKFLKKQSKHTRNGSKKKFEKMKK